MFIRKKELEEIKETIQRMDDRIETLEYKNKEINEEIDLLKYPNGRIKAMCECTFFSSDDYIIYIYKNNKYKLYNLKEKDKLIESQITRKENNAYIKIILIINNKKTDKYYVVKNSEVHETNSNWQIQF